MKHAVLSISGSQYLVEEGAILTIDQQKTKEGEKISTQDILLYADDKETKIGTPKLEDFEIKYQILKNYKGKKLRVSTYKAKSRYRRVIGFKPCLTDIKILSIDKKKSKTSSSKAKS